MQTLDLFWYSVNMQPPSIIRLGWMCRFHTTWNGLHMQCGVFYSFFFSFRLRSAILEYSLASNVLCFCMLERFQISLLIRLLFPSTKLYSKVLTSFLIGGHAHKKVWLSVRYSKGWLTDTASRIKHTAEALLRDFKFKRWLLHVLNNRRTLFCNMEVKKVEGWVINYWIM